MRINTIPSARAEGINIYASAMSRGFLLSEFDILLEARAGFEPANEGFADLAIRPLWYRANLSFPLLESQLYGTIPQ